MDNIFSHIKHKFVDNWLPRAVETNTAGDMFYWLWTNEACRQMYSENKVECFENRNAYALAGGLSEIFFPLDAIADRVASLPYDILNDKGEIAEPPKNIRRLIEEPNMFSTFSENLYNSVFNELSDGNNYIYTKIPSSFSNITPESISSVWVLQPDKVDIRIRQTRPSFFEATSKEDIIEYYSYCKYDDEKLNPLRVIHERSASIGDCHCGLKAPSPLNAARRNINNLLAVYEARYKVFVSNGSAGILTRDANIKSDALTEAIDPVERDRIIEDIVNRNGLTGDKKFWTVTPIPLKFIKTLATIQELQPFDETHEDALQIAGIMGVDKDLIPLREGTTFTNKEQAEKNLYQNVIIGMAHDKARSFTKAYALDTIGLHFEPNFKNIAVLQEDRKEQYDGDRLLIENIVKLRDSGLMDEDDAKIISDKLIERYRK